MKRVKAGCILQTLVFSQKPEMGYSKDRAFKLNHEESVRWLPARIRHIHWHHTRQAEAGRPLRFVPADPSAAAAHVPAGTDLFSIRYRNRNTDR